MARKLAHLSAPIRNYANQRFHQRINTTDGELPIVLMPAYLRGHALFTERLFANFEKRHFIDPTTQVFLWERLVIDNHFIDTVIEHAELDLLDDAFTLYCLILWDAHVRRENQIVEQMTTGFVTHFLPSIFPKTSEKDSIATMQKEIAKILARQWHIRPDIKESFITETDSVIFKLLAKVPNHESMQLIELTGTRLKPTRQEAYERVLGALRMERLRFDVPKRPQ